MIPSGIEPETSRLVGQASGSNHVEWCLCVEDTGLHVAEPVQGVMVFNPLNAELNPIRHLLVSVGVRHIVHVSRIRVKVG